MADTVIGVRNRLFWAAVVSFCSVFMWMTQAAARPGRSRSGNAQADSQRRRKDRQVFGQLAKAWAAFYGGKYAPAARCAEPLVKLPEPRYRPVVNEAAHIQARSYWAAGGKRNRAKARRIAKQLGKRSQDRSVAARLKIMQALELESAGSEAGLEQAVTVLEGLYKARQRRPATAEAAVELARLYVKVKRIDDAEKALRFAIAFLGDKRNLVRMEVTDERVVKPCIDAAQAALKGLKYETDTGLEAFEAAEKLRKKKQWLAAYRAYHAVAKDFPETDYAPRSQLAMGHCLIGLNRGAQAVMHWRRFVEAQSAGPWRAQAFMALIDILLEERLDPVGAGKYAELARSALPTALADKKSADSWKAAAFDVHLRVGLVSFCQGLSAQAAEAFGQAQKLAADKATAERLTDLIAAARTGKAVIPEDCRSTSDPTPVETALSLGVICHLAGRRENAEAFFDRVLGSEGGPGQPARRPMRGASPGQRAFAIFGQGMILHGRRRTDEAKARFLASIKAYPAGSWHDESLYRVATIIQADAALAHPPTLPKQTGRGKRPTVKERKAAAQAERQRLAALVQARGEALPYWREIVKRYPNSSRREQAMYEIGALQYDLADLASSAEQARTAARSQQMFTQAAATLKRFCEAYPESPRAGDAYVRQIDIALERMFELGSAKQLSDSSLEWTQTRNRKRHDAPGIPLPAWSFSAASNGTLSSGDRHRHGAYRCLVYAGMVAYLEGDLATSAKHFRAAQPLSPPRPRPEEHVILIGPVKGDMETLAAIASAGTSLTPEAARRGSERAALMLQLADLHHAARNLDRILSLCTRVIDMTEASHVQRSWAFHTRAHAQYEVAEPTRSAAAQADFLASARTATDAPWAGAAFMHVGNIRWNENRDADAAIRCWRELLAACPGSDKAEEAAFRIGTLYLWTGKLGQARKAYQEVQRLFPQGEYARFAAKRIRHLAEHNSR